MSKRRILIVDDEKKICTLIGDILIDEGYQVFLSYSAHEALKSYNEFKPDLVLLDVWLKDGDGLNLLKKWHNKYTDCVFIMMSGHANIETAVNATHLGAYNFLEKPINLSDLTLTIRRALEYLDLRKENKILRAVEKQRYIEPVGNTPVIKQLKQQCQQISQHETPVIISGEAGSGRHTFAYYLQFLSKKKRLANINCSVITDDQIEGELFGKYTEDSFVPGKLDQAQGGVLLLDDLESMSSNLQGVFFDILKNRCFKSGDAVHPVQFRVICIAKPVIENLVATAVFRSDLFYQLNVLLVSVPSLIDRIEDIADIINYYINLFYQTDGMHWIELSEQALSCLKHYSWPGNVMELKNLIQRLMILGQGKISASVISSMLSNQMIDKVDSNVAFNWHQSYKTARREFDKDYFKFHLQTNDSNIAKVAKITGIERSNLYRKIKDLGLD